MVDEVMDAALKTDNAHVKKHGIDFSPLRERRAQFEKLRVIHKKTCPRRSLVENYSYEPADGIHMLAAKFKDSEHPEWKELEDGMNEEQKYGLNVFVHAI